MFTSRLSPMQRITFKPPSIAALTLRETNCNLISTTQTFPKKELTYIIILPQQHPPLTVANNHPIDANIPQLLNADLARECAVRLIVDVLRGDADRRVGELPSERQVQRRRRDDDLCVRIARSGVEVVDNRLDGVCDSIPGCAS